MLESGEASPNALAIDATAVYYVAFVADGAVRMVPKSGGAARSIATNQPYPEGIAVDGSGVYWAAGRSGADGTITRADKDGAARVTLASGQTAPSGIALDADSAYWANYLGPGGINARAKVGAGATRALVISGTGLTEVAVDDADVYYLDFYASTLNRVPKRGGGSSVLATEKGLLGGFAIDATSAYVAAGKDIVRIDKATRTSTILATGAGPSGVAVDADAVYFTDPGAGQVLRVSKAGGAPVVLATGQNGPSRVAVDAWCVYWTNRGSSQVSDGSVMKTRK